MDRTFFEIFFSLEDPRNDKGKKYPLIDVIILAIYGTLIGFEDFTNMSYYLKKRESELTEQLGLTAGVPSHGVFSDVFRALDVERFMELFINWTKSVANVTPESHIAIDGKAVRASAKKSAGGRVPYIVSAFLVGNGISIGQKIVGDKTNEITEIPKLLDALDIKDCFVTIDAIGTQTKIMEKIIGKGGHFCLQLKNNHKEPFDAAKLFFDDLEQNVPRVFNSMDCYVKKIKDYGRCESREYRVLTDEKDIQVLLGNKWPYAKCIGMASLTRRAGEEVSHEVHFHVLDTAVSAEKYANLARGHWEIENNLHWVLDMHFREDASTANTDHAIENLALLRKIAFNFANLDDSMKVKSIKKKMIDYMIDLDLFNRLIYEIFPNRA